MTYVIDAVRSLVLGMPVGAHGWSAVGWAIGISIAISSFSRRQPSIATGGMAIS